MGQQWDQLDWKKSSRSSGNGNCVEVAVLNGGGVAVRDTKDKGAGPVLQFDAAAWEEFKDGVRDYDFD